MDGAEISRPGSRGSEGEEITVMPDIPEHLEEDEQGWKFMSCTSLYHCQELGQQASWLLIGYTRQNNQLEVSKFT